MPLLCTPLTYTSIIWSSVYFRSPVYVLFTGCFPFLFTDCSLQHCHWQPKQINKVWFGSTYN